MRRLEFNEDGKVDFAEFGQFCTQYPALFYPAFRLQTSMVAAVLGEGFWEKKKAVLQSEKERFKAIKNKAKAKETSRLLAMQARKIRKKMGLLQYYCCPFKRGEWAKMFPVEVKEEKKELTPAELNALRAKAREMERKLAELQIKNPETPEWQMYLVQKKQRALVEGAKKKVKPRVEETDRTKRMHHRRRRKEAEARQ